MILFRDLSCQVCRESISVIYRASHWQDDVGRLLEHWSTPDLLQSKLYLHLYPLVGSMSHIQYSDSNWVIVKFRDPKSGIRCDLNVNHQPGYWNSIMIGRYATLSPHLPRLMLAIKRWSRPIGLNNPSPSKRLAITFSSYAFALMTIGFLQVSWRSVKFSKLTALSKSTAVYCRTCKKT